MTENIKLLRAWDGGEVFALKGTDKVMCFAYDLDTGNLLDIPNPTGAFAIAHAGLMVEGSLHLGRPVESWGKRTENERTVDWDSLEDWIEKVCKEHLT